MTRQPFAWIDDDVPTCAWCAAPVCGDVMEHKDDCRWIDEIREHTPQKWADDRARDAGRDWAKKWPGGKDWA